MPFIGIKGGARGGGGRQQGRKQATGRQTKSSAATHSPPPCLLRLGRVYRWGVGGDLKRAEILFSESHSFRRRVASVCGTISIPTSPRAERRKREGPGGKHVQGEETRGLGGGREHHRLDSFFNISQRFNPSPPPLPLFTHQAQLTRYQQGGGVGRGRDGQGSTEAQRES